MVLVYLSSVSNRARYIFRLFFQDLIGLEFSLTSSTEEFKSYNGPKVNYSDTKIGDEIHIIPGHILFENDIIPQKTYLSEYEGLPIIFPSRGQLSDLPFDPFAAGFYMVSRYEEYLPYKGDRYGRYRSKGSIVFLGKFLWKPVVNYWAKMVEDILVRRYPALCPIKRKFRFISTIDIDHAYAFGHRSFTRILGGYGRDISNGEFRSLLLRTKVLMGKEKDPYDTYDMIHEINQKYDVKPVYFILFADYGKNDNNVTLSDREFRALIRKLDQQAEVGIHPSLISDRNFPILEREITRLSELLEHDISKSRQHFLKISLPRTYRNLRKLGITDDYSMGYASDAGFRAGIAGSFHFFDLPDNTETELRIHPVTVMDVTLRDYYNLSREKSLDLIYKLIDTVRSVDGEFISLWHNESFSDSGRWKGWQSVYEEMLRYATG